MIKCFFRLSLPDEECGGESRLADLRDPQCHQHGSDGRGNTKTLPYPPAAASRGVPAPISWRISNDRLWLATWSRHRLCTFSRPRGQVRRMPPRSRLWAKERSTISARSLKALRATSDLSRARLLVSARRAASSPCQREKPVCLGAASGSSRDHRPEPSRPPVSDTLCRRRIRPGVLSS